MGVFCNHLKSLDGLNIQPEHGRLLFRYMAADSQCGIERRKFFSFLQQYFVVVKAVAVTSDFDIGKSKTVRKAAEDEIMVVLEGPKIDDKLGLTRILAKSMTDGSFGWISVRGNQGTAFLQEVEKPFYVCVEEVMLEKRFESKGREPIRMLKVDEVIEVVEGPRKEANYQITRSRYRACSDGAVGWITERDGKDIVVVEQGDKYYVCTMSVAITDKLNIKECKSSANLLRA